MERYRLDGRPFALGASSAVYDCTDVSTGERLAAKVIDCRTDSGKRRAQQMLRATALLERAGPHEGLLAVRAAMCADSNSNSNINISGGRAVFVMERLRGGTLLAHIAQRGRLRELEAAHIAAQLLRALAHLHRGGAMHRDVKPENILLRDTRSPMSNSSTSNTSSSNYNNSNNSNNSNNNSIGGPRIVLADFGLCCGTSQCAAEVVGSPPYAAPEVARLALSHDTIKGTMEKKEKEKEEQRKNSNNKEWEKRPYDERCDVWAAGVVVYAMLSGRLPFDGLGPRDVFAAVCRGAAAVPFPRDAWHGVSECAQSFVLRLMTSDASRRPTAAEALSHPWLALAHA